MVCTQKATPHPDATTSTETQSQQVHGTELENTKASYLVWTGTSIHSTSSSAATGLSYLQLSRELGLYIGLLLCPLSTLPSLRKYSQ